MTDEQKKALFRLRLQARALMDQIDKIWETAADITGEPVDNFEEALCTYDFIWNGSNDVEQDFELLTKVMDRKYGATRRTTV